MGKFYAVFTVQGHWCLNYKVYMALEAMDDGKPALLAGRRCARLFEQRLQARFHQNE